MNRKLMATIYELIQAVAVAVHRVGFLNTAATSVSSVHTAAVGHQCNATYERKYGKEVGLNRTAWLSYESFYLKLSRQ